ncbi:MAG TPA: DUF2007 domain-containing protein [Actinomycetota bacterium]|nr:DUF2007 domain-containing protein [Actinomycetota bacterium]
MDDELVQVFSASHMDAEFVRSILEANEIPAMLSGEGHSSAYPVNVGGLGGGRVLVRKEDEAKAREIIEGVERGDYALAEDEDVEGEPVED